MKQKNITIHKCIYCDGAGETDEHIIPLALGGITKLLKASCENCRTITSKCELNPLKENWEQVRAICGYPSRHKNFSNMKFPLKVTLEDGSEKILELSKNESAGLAVFLEYPLPGFFTPGIYKSGSYINASNLISYGISIEILKKKYGFKEVECKYKDTDHSFAKMVAKIGYCAAVSIFGIDSFDQRFVLPTLLNKKDDIGFWMGCDNEGKIIPLIGKTSNQNVVIIHIMEKANSNDKYIFARLKFFAFSETPEYIVVIGTLKKDFTIDKYRSSIHVDT